MPVDQRRRTFPIEASCIDVIFQCLEEARQIQQNGTGTGLGTQHICCDFLIQCNPARERCRAGWKRFLIWIKAMVDNLIQASFQVFGPRTHDHG